MLSCGRLTGCDGGEEGTEAQAWMQHKGDWWESRVGRWHAGREAGREAMAGGGNIYPPRPCDL